MSDSKNSIASAFGGGADTKLTSNDASALEAIRRASGGQAFDMQNSIGTQSRWSKVTDSLSRAFSTPPSLSSLLVCGAMTAGSYAFGNRTLSIIDGVVTAYGTYRYLTDVTIPSSVDPEYIKIPDAQANDGEQCAGMGPRLSVAGDLSQPEASSAE